ncbi:MAG TPA: acyl-[ACP]--phospholipid O-acyltransferase [Candidatus Sulfopaludibacter sp.]|nr:acyl-[ACP]--phospholipid O-acyltransferase [Candidatus Sulfopaludibacter sp.]
MAQRGFKEVLNNGGFQAFLWTQFLGAFNDNAYRIIVSLRAVHIVAQADQSGKYLSLTAAIFVLPSLFFAGYAGHLADALSKRKVLIGVKAFEIFAMAVGILTFLSTNVAWMFIVLFLMALHSTVFSPAKYSIVPEMVADRDLSRANALVEMSTLVAIVLGTAIGPFLFTQWRDEAWKVGVVMLAVAIAGYFTSLRITRVPAAGAKEPFRLNPFAEVAIGTKHLLADRPMWFSVLGISYFWFLGLLFSNTLLLFGKENLHVSDSRIGLMITCLSLGIGAGSMLCGRLSGDKVEIGLVPVGGTFIGIFCIAMGLVNSTYFGALVVLACLGIATGLFFVPLNAYLQQRSEAGEKGRIIATNNIYNTIGMLLAATVPYLLHDRLHMRPDRILVVFGFVTLLVTVFIVGVVNEFLIRFLLWIVTHTLFRIRIVGQENVPFRGPALLVSNHMSHIDGFLIGACVQRFIRFMVWKPYYQMKPLNWFLRKTYAIPVGTSNAREAVEAIRAARRQLEAGHVVCIFAEGAITRTGNMLPFKRGMEKIVAGTNVPVIPVHLDGVWGSIFSFEGGKFFWKWPKTIPYAVTVSFGAPMASGVAAHEVRQAIQELSADAAAHRYTDADRLDRRVIRTARRNWNRFAMADSSGRELTYGRMLTGSVMMAAWARGAGADGESIGVLLPPTVPGALVNIGITIAGRVPVNLNFTAGREAMASAMQQCGIRTVVTSKIFLAKAKLEAFDGMVFVEDVLARAGKVAKLRALLMARLAPEAWLSRSTAGTASVIFSSGSTGVPKGVMLSHTNVLANIESIAQVFGITPRDRIVGVLPFFHSFGYTVTIWFPMVSGCGVVYHPNPTDAKGIGELVARHRATLLLSTPTFCSTYTRKCSQEEFASLRYVLVGAEKLREPVAAAFREKFGVELMEGYGCTEMSPVVAVNAPDFESNGYRQTGHKDGTVGHPLPGVAAKIVDPVTLRPLPPNQEGLLLVKGANRMVGYLGEPERTAESCHEGWYITGDIALLDDEGFLRITDRLSRFSKIAGEMVPHLKIEEALSGALGDVACAVTAIADDVRGERLVALYVHAEISPAEVWQRLAGTELPRLWLPKREDIHAVEALPLLGTGKLDLRGAKSLAQQLSGVIA